MATSSHGHKGDVIDSTLSPKPRILIFIVAYNAEKTLSSVLERISLSEDALNVDILIIDDASQDKTFSIGLNQQTLHGYRTFVLKNPVNQGYGGNQKLGYHYAIKHGYDVVVLLHGDGQYSPEKLSDLIQPLLNNEADAVFGSRMLIPGNARRGGMPLYKYLGNIILSTTQNLLLKTDLSEFHSGYRAYRVSTLKQIPFEFNTDDFHFDTEIIIQLLAGGFRIKEVPIPTYYGDEICYVNGLKYAKDVILATLGYRLHNMGIFYRNNFDLHQDGDQYSPKFEYCSSHTLAIQTVPSGCRVLDIGCGSRGHVAARLREKRCTVFGVDNVPVAVNFFKEFVQLDLDTGTIPEHMCNADYILLLDILEHLRDPEAFMLRLRSSAARYDPVIVISVPNIAFIISRFMLFLGQFNYGKFGILDKTHHRLFTFASLQRLLEQTGFEVKESIGIPAPFPKALPDSTLGHRLLSFNQATIRLWKRLFSYQIFVLAKVKPTVETLLDTTCVHSRELSQKHRHESMKNTNVRTHSTE